MNGKTSATLALILLSNAGSMMLILVLPSLRENEKQEALLWLCCKTKSGRIHPAPSAGKTCYSLWARENMKPVKSAGKQAYSRSHLVLIRSWLAEITSSLHWLVEIRCVSSMNQSAMSKEKMNFHWVSHSCPCSCLSNPKHSRDRHNLCRVVWAKNVKNLKAVTKTRGQKGEGGLVGDGIRGEA